MSKNIKLANVVPAQLPAHIRQDYPTFEAFMKAYYEYLDQQQLTRNLEYLRDVDKTLDVFVASLKEELAVLAPHLAQDRFFLKHAKELYVSRGTEESYKFLFRLLYNKEVETVQLNEKILKASGGHWQQDVSFFIKLESGKVSSLENNFVHLNSKMQDGTTIQHERVYVLKVEKVEFTQDIYEVFINRQYYGKATPGDTITDLGVTATVVPTTTSIKIVNPGSGFKLGEIFDITTNLGTGLQVKVTGIDRATGGLKTLQIIGFGVGFEQPFDYNITRFLPAESSQSVVPNPAPGQPNVKTIDVLNNSNDAGYITKQSFHEDYVAGDYVGEVLADFYSKTIPEGIETTVATLQISLGGMAIYPGFYKNSQSLISDDSYIQDGYYYQDFSYLLRIDEKLSDYKQIIASTLHPVGRKMFGDYLIETTYDFTYEVFNPVIRLFFPFTPETLEAVDALDHVLSSVVQEQFTGNGVDHAFTYLEESLNHVILNVRVGTGVTFETLPIMDPANYSVSNGVITFLIAPADGATITLTYGTINYNPNPAWLDHTVIMHKVLNDSTSGVYDTPTQRFSKELNPSTGYVDEVSMIDPARANLTGKTFPSLEILADSGATDNQKDYFVMADADPTRLIGKRFALTDLGNLIGRPEDTLAVIESLTNGFSKALVDSTLSTDSTTSAFSKALEDSTTHSDSTTNAIVKLFTPAYSNSDEVQATEAAAVGFTMAPLASSNITLGDTQPSVEAGKGLTDNITAGDALSPYVFNKYLNDSVEAIDVVALTSTLYPFADSAELSDILAVTNADGAYLSQATMIETSAIELSRQLDDSTTVNTTSAWLQVNPYSSEAYFPNGYQSGGITNL